jgi:hypothetical protein
MSHLPVGELQGVAVRSGFTAGRIQLIVAVGVYHHS